MKRLNNKGYMIVEIIVSATIAMTIAYFMMDLIVKLKEKHPLKYIELAETISEGQKVESFKIYSKNDDNLWNFEEHGTTIGSRKIVVLDNVTTDEIKVHITSARDVVKLDWVKVY